MRIQGKITHWNEQKAYGFIGKGAGYIYLACHVTRKLNNCIRPLNANAGLVKFFPAIFQYVDLSQIS